MPSPDFSKYINLTVYDVEPYTIYDDAINYAKTALPELEPRRGTIEDALLQATAYSTSLMVGAINRLPNGLMEGILKLMGFARLEATYATGNVLFTVYDNSGMTIRSGTVIQYEVISGDKITSYAFETIANLLIPAGETTGEIGIKAINAGLYPLLLTGQGLTLVSPAASVLTAVLTENLIIGSNAETDAAYFNRATQHLSTLNTTLCTAGQISNYIKVNYPNITYFQVYDLTIAGNMSFDWVAPGYITIAMCDVVGDPISTAISDPMFADIAARGVAGLQYNKYDMLHENLNISCGIVVSSGFSPSTVAASVKSAIEAYLSFEGFNFSQHVYTNQLIAIASQVAGCRYVTFLSMDSYEGDGSIVDGVLTLTNKGEIPIGVVDVTVV